MRLALFNEGEATPSAVVDWLSQDEAEAVVCFIDEMRLLTKLGGHGCIEAVTKDGVFVEFRTTRKKRLRGWSDV